MMGPCHECDGFGSIDMHKSSRAEKPTDAEKALLSPQIDRRSRSYKDSIMKIMELHPDKSRDECIEIFDLEYSKL